MVSLALDLPAGELYGHGLRVVPRPAVHNTTPTIPGPVHHVLPQAVLDKGRQVVALLLLKMLKLEILTQAYLLSILELNII